MNNTHLLRPLAVFQSIAANGSFIQAAQELGISAPLASQILSNLENELDVQLFYRSTRSLKLTDAGNELLVNTAQAFETIFDGLNLIRNRNSKPKGKLKITAPTILATSFATDFIGKYHQRHPDLEIEMIFCDEILDPIKAGIDLAIRIGQPEDSNRVVRKFLSSRGILVGSKEEKIAKHPKDLARHNLIRPPTFESKIALNNGTKTADFIPNRTLVINESMIVKSLVRRGFGLALYPEFSVQDDLATGRLINVLPDWSIKNIDVWVLFTARSSRLSNAGDFAKKLFEQLQAQPLQ